LDKSTKSHENDRYYCARNILGIVHAVLVGFPCMVCLFAFIDEPWRIQYTTATAGHIDACAASPPMEEWNTSAQVMALAGLAFTTFTTADAIISGIHGLLTIEYAIHHAAFIGCGVIIRTNCMLPFTAAALLSMEVSTPFLNYLIFFRHRGDKYKRGVIVSGLLFLVTYFLFRIIFNMYATVELIVVASYGMALPQSVPVWQGYFLIAAVCVGASLQLFWLPGIWRSMGGKLRALIQKGDCSTGDCEDPAKVKLLNCEAEDDEEGCNNKYVS